MKSRRDFVQHLAATTGAVVLAPFVKACGGASASGTAESTPAAPASTAEADPMSIPQTLPAGWDPIAFNRARGNAGAIPDSYRDDINGPDGETKHLGKHLPYFPAFEGASVPAGYAAVMWGDPSKGYAQHPNARPNEGNHHEGHWYNWIRVRKATDGEAEELESEYSSWPTVGEGDNGKYVAAPGGSVEDNDGKGTIYLVALPADTQPGDTVRIHAHCLTHGEYVDFVTLPA